jgi:hypothetical protein
MGITIDCGVPGQPAVSYRISTFDRSGKSQSTRHGQAMSWDNNSKRPESKTCSSWVSLLPDGHVFLHNFSISFFLRHFPQAYSRDHRESCSCSPTARGLS